MYNILGQFMKRDLSLDFLKFSLVILVILGHAIQFYLAKFGYDFDESTLYRFIYSFHMPLFIFLSGCLFSLSKTLEVFKLFKLLIIPFFVWGSINFFIKESDLTFIEHIYKIVVSPDSSLWFLWVLFWLMLSTNILLRLSKGVNVLFLLLSLLYGVFLYITFLIFDLSSFGFKLYTWYWFFFISGVFFYKNKSGLGGLKRNRINISLVIAYVFVFTLWKRDINSYDFFFNPIINSAIGLMVNYICSFLFITFVAINWQYMKSTLFPRCIVFCSVNSLAFYAIQFPVIDTLLRYDFTSNIFIDILCVFFLSILISSFLIVIINKFSFCRRILFGR